MIKQIESSIEFDCSQTYYDDCIKKLKRLTGQEFKDKNMETIEHANAAKLTGPHFTLGELAIAIGWNQGA
jgi:hypothetical protein